LFAYPYVSGSVNLFPETTCIDRSLLTRDPFTSVLLTETNNYSYYFYGYIYDDRFYMSRESSNSEIPIKFITGSNGKLMLVLEYNPADGANAYGLTRRPLQIHMEIGPDIATSWEQQIILLKSCHPSDLRWQIISTE
jgi:hypothetical protein